MSDPETGGPRRFALPDPDGSLPVREGFDPALAGRRAECDGGGPIQGSYFAGRMEFTGRLTGDYIDHGDPPWRWVLMVDLERKPPTFEGDAVWCESGSVFLLDGEQKK